MLVSLVGCSSIDTKRELRRLSYSKDQNVAAQVIKAQLRDNKDLTFGNIVLEKSKFQDVHRDFGDTKILKVQHPSYAVFSSCYVDGDNRVIKFSSDSVMGGEIVFTVEIFDKKTTDIQGCLTVKDNVPTSNKRGIALGLSKEEVFQKLGMPSLKPSDEEMEYIYFDRTKRSGCNGGWDVSGNYKFKFFNNKVIYMRVSKSTTC